MKHGSIVLFDHALRKAWYSPHPFPVSAALYVSAAIGTQLRSTKE